MLGLLTTLTEHYRFLSSICCKSDDLEAVKDEKIALVCITIPRQTRTHDENQFRENVHDTSVNIPPYEDQSSRGIVPIA